MLMRAVPRPLVGLSLAIVLMVAGACGSNPKVQKAPVAPAQSASPVAPVQTPAPAPDPIAALIQTSQDHFAAGERELKLGHLERARVEFDRAVDVLLESPYGARTDARMREHFDRLVDRINAHEVTALAQGDGFSETKTEPASIDEILTIATFPRPDTKASTEEAVKADLAADRARRSHSAECEGPGRRRTSERPSSRLRAGEPDPRVEIPADDPERLPRRGAAARPGVHPGHRERFQDQRAVEGEREGARGSS